jgi:hypothetical protein
MTGRADILPANVGGEPPVGSRSEAVPAGGYKPLPYIFADRAEAGRPFVPFVVRQT